MTDETDLCIEGFPRSANSFAVGAVEQAHDDPLTIAHHNHVPAPILNAVQRRLPTIVLIREPVEAVVSRRALQLQIGAVEEKRMPQYVSYERDLRAWIGFYETVWPVRENVVVAPFDVVIDDFGRIIHAVNTQCGTDFARFDHTDENVAAIRNARGYHALPSEQREAMKERARDRFEADLGEAHPLVEAARELHRRFVEHSTLP